MGRLVTWLVVIAVMGACNRNRPVPEPGADVPTRVVVDNQAFNDMNIYILDGAQRVRLGTANGLTKTGFNIPKYLVRVGANLRFLADPIGGNRASVSQSITVNPGDEVVMQIPPA
jgi:hypothetical protein